MAQITSTRQLIVWQGDTVNIADVLTGLPVQRIYRLLANGNWVSYQVMAPQFAPFQTFERGQLYFLVSGSKDFDLPNAATEAYLVANPGGDVLVLNIPAGTTATRRYTLNAYPTTLGAPKFFDAAKNETAGNLTVQLDNGTPTDYATFNAAIASLAESDYAANTHKYTLSFSITSNVAGSMELPIY
jgi:hypothetical protein